MYKYIFKRYLDIFSSFCVLYITWPVLLLVAIGIKITSDGPVFFVQKRLGKNGKIFRLCKFRTMTNAKRDVNREILKGDEEVTTIGSVLRRLKIDEIPQLLNVLNGDMSIVGPRPSMPEMLNKLNETGKVRLKVSPGLTGLAQVNGNIYLEWEDRWKYDKYYVENLSFLLDLKIIIKTVSVIFRGEKEFLNKPENKTNENRSNRGREINGNNGKTFSKVRF